MSTTPEVQNQQFGLRRGAEEFPLMLVISMIYPCNFGCPNCPYTDANSEIRQFYHQHDGDLFPVDFFKVFIHHVLGIPRIEPGVFRDVD